MPLPLPLLSFVRELRSILYGFQIAPVVGPKSSVYEYLFLSAPLSNMALKFSQTERERQWESVIFGIFERKTKKEKNENSTLMFRY